MTAMEFLVFYRDLEPMPGALDAFNWLNEHFDVYICSSPSWRNPSSWIDKRLWVDNVLGEKARKKLILTHNKGLVRGDYLIDDNVWNGVEDFKGRTYSLWNRNELEISCRIP